MAQSIFDKVCFQILAALFDNREGLRFKDIKKRLTVSDPVISNRLSLLKVHGLVEVSPVMGEDMEANYFVYRITQVGIKFADRVDITTVLDAVKEIDNRSRLKK